MKPLPMNKPPCPVFAGEPPLVLVGRTSGEIRTGGAPRCPACQKVQRLTLLTAGMFNRCLGCKSWFWFEMEGDTLYPYLTNLEGPAYRPTLKMKPRGRRRRKAVADATS